MKLQTFFSVLFFLAIMLFLPTLIHAQPGDPGGQPTAAPFDGGLSLVIAAGVGYAVKKRHNQRKKQKTDTVESQK